MIVITIIITTHESLEGKFASSQTHGIPLLTVLGSLPLSQAEILRNYVIT
jgi:hypothetical protein